MTEKLVISGVGFASPFGTKISELASAMFADESCFVPSDIIEGVYLSSDPVFDLSKHVLKASSRRMMGPMIAQSVYAAGDAMRSAKLSGDSLREADVIVSCTSGERDYSVDQGILTDYLSADRAEGSLNRSLQKRLRPTHFLKQLPNFAAAAIAREFGVRGSSRTLLGEAYAGLGALIMASNNITTGRSKISIVGASQYSNCPYWLGALRELGLTIDPDDYCVFSKNRNGLILGSASVFLVMETEKHAEKRGTEIFAYLDDCFFSENRARNLAQLAISSHETAIFSGANGMAQSFCDEVKWLSDWIEVSRFSIRPYCQKLGFANSASLFLGILSAIACFQTEKLPPPFCTNSFEDMENGECGDVNSAIVSNIGLQSAAKGAVLLSRPGI